VKLGDLIKYNKKTVKDSLGSIGIVIEIFDDLGESDPWIRILFTHPNETLPGGSGQSYRWVKRSGLIVVGEEKEDRKTPLHSGAATTGSL